MTIQNSGRTGFWGSSGRNAHTKCLVQLSTLCTVAHASFVDSSHVGPICTGRLKFSFNCN